MPATPQELLDPLRDLFELDSVGAIILDSQCQPLFINAQAQRILHLPASATRADLLAIDQLQWFGTLDLLPLASPLGPLEITLAHGAARTIVDLRARSIPAAHLLAGYSLLTLVDVTRQRDADEALKDNLKYTTDLSQTALAQAVELKRQSQTLERRVGQRTGQLHAAHRDAVWMLALACEAKDQDTGQHIRRIQHHTESLARKIGLPEDQVETLGISSLLHDVGKLHIPDAILAKPGELTDQERQIMQSHTLHGHRIILESPFMHSARIIARSHHENWDGSGYPDGLAGPAIPLAARIVHVVDVYDALISPRIYKPAWTHAAAMLDIRRHSGIMFDPDLVRAFESITPDPSTPVSAPSAPRALIAPAAG